jgi:tRNA (guanosine-2'-O-)-methyltransferase
MLSTKRLNRFKEVIANRQAGLVLVLEDIHDPHNAAAILRTCDGLGIQDVYFIFAQEKPYNPKKVGKVTSSSANKWLNFHIFNSTKDCLKELKKQKYQVYATILNKDAIDATSCAFNDSRMALVVGNEHRGISPEMIAGADKLIYLPMKGFVESFNVSVSAGLFLYEIIRQRMQADKKEYHLSAKEQAKLLADFKKR